MESEKTKFVGFLLVTFVFVLIGIVWYSIVAVASEGASIGERVMGGIICGAFALGGVSLAVLTIVSFVAFIAYSLR